MRFVGRGGGWVKNLAGFRKQHHTVPDAVNAATAAFLAKLCAGELAQEGEAVFQRAREAFRYKRAELALELAAPRAVISAKDFTFELGYALDENDPATFVLTRELHGLHAPETLRRPELETVFGAQFDCVAFDLGKGVEVEAVIDAVEALPPGMALRVDYPSDCRQCVLKVQGIAAEVVCDGTTLEMRFPRAGSPRELAEAFLAVREAFALSKKRVLAGLI